MRYVFDSNVAIKWVLPEADSPQALRLRDLARQGSIELCSPEIFAVEAAHALSRAERRGVIRPPNGAKHLADIMTHRPRLVPSLPLLSRAFEISSAFRIGVYDCLYVALAEREACELITADLRLVNALGASFPFIRDLASVP